MLRRCYPIMHFVLYAENLLVWSMERRPECLWRYPCQWNWPFLHKSNINPMYSCVYLSISIKQCPGFSQIPSSDSSPDNLLDYIKQSLNSFYIFVCFSHTMPWKVHLQTAVLIFTSLQSELSWKLALEWTEAVIPTVQLNLVAESSTEQDVQNVKFMLDSWKTLASDCLNQVFMGSSWSELTRTLEKVFAGSSTGMFIFVWL